MSILGHKASAIVAENRQLRTRVERLERELVRRQTDSVRSRLVPLAVAPPPEVEPPAYAQVIRCSWARVDHDRACLEFTARVDALDPRPRRSQLVTADQADRIIAAIVDVGPRAAARALREGGDVTTDDRFIVGAEAALYAMALGLGSQWTDATRAAWCAAIDDLGRALGIGSRADFSSDEISMESNG